MTLTHDVTLDHDAATIALDHIVATNVLDTTVAFDITAAFVTRSVCPYDVINSEVA
jgi:hypothetical protein